MSEQLTEAASPDGGRLAQYAAIYKTWPKEIQQRAQKKVAELVKKGWTAKAAWDKLMEIYQANLQKGQ